MTMVAALEPRYQAILAAENPPVGRLLGDE